LVPAATRRIGRVAALERLAAQNPSTGDPNHYLNLNCFTPPALPAGVSAASLPFPCNPGSPAVAAAYPNTCLNLFGNNGRNSLIGPNLTDFDFSLFKNNYIPRISEAFNIQFRAEFFNILNHPNFQPPFDTNTIFDANGVLNLAAGKINFTATDSRQIQLGLKLVCSMHWFSWGPRIYNPALQLTKSR